MNRIELQASNRAPLRITILAALTLMTLLGLPHQAQAQAQWTTAPNGTDIYKTSNGNVGIGTSAPGAALEINNIASGDQLRIGNGTGLKYSIGRNTGDGLLEFSGDQTFFQGYRFKIYNLDVLTIPRIDRGGGANTIELVFGRGQGTAWPLGGTLRAPDAAGTNIAGANLTISPGLATGNALTGDLLFLGADAGSSGITPQSATTRLVVKGGTGNVGIGTTTPDSRLHIAGNNTATGGYPLIKLQNTQVGGHSYWLYSGANGAAGDFAIWDETASSWGLYIKSNGNVGIGTGAPTTKLDVAGQVRSSVGGFKFPDGTVQTTAAVSGGGTITGVAAGTGLTGGGTSGSVTLTNADRGSSQSIFKNIANATGATQFSAGSNNDSLRFEGSGGTSVTFDAVSKKIVINSSASGPTVSAANVSAGEFGQNTGGGNFNFPGNVTVAGNLAAKYQDIAEWVPANHALSAGTVVVLNPTQSNQVMASTQSYDTRVAGVISERPGLALGEAGKDKVLVATTGRVKVKVDATRAAIHVGDLLVTSDQEGVAMRSEPLNLGGAQIHRPGTLIGKALEPLEKGQGEILVLLSLQ